jgi:6-phosphogluconolactonase (cycloisomerase 2 family)
MKTRLVFWLICTGILGATPLLAQQYIFTNDNVSPTLTNSTTALNVAANGAITVIATYSTGGASVGGGGYYALQGVVSAQGNPNSCLFVSNGGDGTIAAFTINMLDGTLTTVAGSPFPVGGPGGTGIALAVGRNKLLFAANTSSNSVYSSRINGDCSLTKLRSKKVRGVPDDLKVSPDGKSLVIPLLGLVDLYAIDYGNGSLQELGPFNSLGSPAGVDISCKGSTVYFGDSATTSAQVEVFRNVSGSFTEVDNFVDNHGSDSNNVVLSADNKTLYVGNTLSGQVTALLTGPNGALTYGSTVTLNGLPGLAYNLAIGSGPYLFVAEPGGSVAVLSAEGSVLSEIQGSPFQGNPFSNLGSLTAVPGKSCTSGSE